jgi:DNA-binding IclR family transcriptional regulator
VLRAFAGEPGRDEAAVRRQGWAVSLGGRDPDLAAVAVPVLNASGVLLGALTVSGLISRFPPAKIAEYRALLIEQAALLRPRMGGPPGEPG